MWIDNAIFKEDMDYILSCESIDWNILYNKTVLVTGATGLIGSTIISVLLYADMIKKLNIRVVALVRDIEKAKHKFSAQIDCSKQLSFVGGSIEKLPNITAPIDYIIHGAGPTASDFFVEYPVETISIAVTGTMNLLNLAVQKATKSFVYLSSMEIYGSPITDDTILESQGTTIDTMAIRSSYPEAKRLCECLCSSYASEYGVSTKVVRLAQTFGPGVDIINDNRVFAEFAKCTLYKNNIVLKTLGSSKRTYLYTADAATAILTVLTKGEMCNAYNAANPETYCSIYDMANMVAREFGDGIMQVYVHNNREQENKYPPTHKLNLDVNRLRNLGWREKTALIDMYRRMIAAMSYEDTTKLTNL